MIDNFFSSLQEALPKEGGNQQSLEQFLEPMTRNNQHDTLTNTNGAVAALIPWAVVNRSLIGLRTLSARGKSCLDY